jgi:plasmid maintenance system antidote protein VapI
MCRLSIDEAACCMGVPRCAYQDIMEGREDITNESFLRFCESTGSNPQTLIALGIERAGRTDE